MPFQRTSVVVCAASVACVALCGCFSNTVALEPEAKSVTLVRESDRPLHCKVLGKINGTSRSSDEKTAKAGAENDFRNHAAELKANFAVAEAERGGHVGTSSERDFFVGGKALLCQTEAMEEADEKAAAVAQAKKEKEDADREQKQHDEHDEPASSKKKAKK